MIDNRMIFIVRNSLDSDKSRSCWWSCYRTIILSSIRVHLTYQSSYETKWSSNDWI